MRMPVAVKPFYLTLPVQHRKVLDLLRERTRKTLKSLILEAVEDLAVKHRLVEDATNVHEWPDWG